MTLGALAWVARRLIRFFLGFSFLSVLSIAVAGDRDDEAYEQAQAAIKAENWQDAIARLEAIRHEYPQHAGALVDLAILYCNIGNAAKTDAALDTLEGVFELPSALAPLIRELRLRPVPAQMRAHIGVRSLLSAARQMPTRAVPSVHSRSVIATRHFM